ncbi:type IV pilin [Halorubrum sp. JWXQ-INN 858]|uniref:type IV pilin n=1 Tax=Halorubrum sp. JWXQ-INN 858 TaxID=2690782 RepID=UPI0013569F06|nr:type IV pilin [Halorubrum sp. JWXQ-INN 858]MWV64823.1 type IV pilin [Halorubrum sp. JWXQ-INN 858]
MDGLPTDDRAFTPIAGTGLLVGVVVLLLAVVGAAMFGFIDAVAPPDAEFHVEQEGDELVVTHLGREPLPAEELYVRGDDPDGTVRFGAWPGDGLVRPGEQITIPDATGNEEVEIVWDPVAFARTETLAEYDPDDEDDWDRGDGLGIDPVD